VLLWLGGQSEASFTGNGGVRRRRVCTCRIIGPMSTSRATTQAVHLDMYARCFLEGDSLFMMVTGSPPVATPVVRAALVAICGANTLSSSGCTALVRVLRSSRPSSVPSPRRFGVEVCRWPPSGGRWLWGLAALSCYSLRALRVVRVLRSSSRDASPAAPALRCRSGGGRLAVVARAGDVCAEYASGWNRTGEGPLADPSHGSLSMPSW
jgi:hypothetical protein